MAGFGTTKKVTVGEMRHRVDIEHKVVAEEPDDRGKPVYEWKVLVRGWYCKIEQLTGGEVETARQLNAEATHRIYMRSRDDVTERMRLVFRGREFYIGYIDDLAQVGRISWMLCAEKK